MFTYKEVKATIRGRHGDNNMNYITYLVIAIGIGLTIANLIYIYSVVRMMRKKK